MARFSQSRRRSAFGGPLIPLLLFAALLLFFAAGISSVSSGSTRRQKEALENALTRSITECYAEEGHYPEGVYYLKEHYGLRYNEDRFYVDYRVRSVNMRPEFTIIERREGH